MAELSRENLDRHQISEPENSSAEILKILEEFVISSKYQLKINKKKDGNIQKKSNNLQENISSNKLFSGFFIVGILSWILTFIMYGIDINEIFIVWFARSANFVLLCSLGLICWRFYQELKKTIKDKIEKAISRAASYEIYTYYEIINLLGNKFSQESLSKEEIRFKIIINQRKNGKVLLNKLIPAFAILIVIWGIYVFGIPNYNQATNQLFSAFLSVSGIITIVKIALNIYNELLSQDLDIYDRCIFILQKSQNIAKEIESNKTSPSINKNIKGKNLFKELKKIKIVDAPRDFSTNFDSYVNREESAGTDIH